MSRDTALLWVTISHMVSAATIPTVQILIQTKELRTAITELMKLHASTEELSLLLDVQQNLTECKQILW